MARVEITAREEIDALAAHCVHCGFCLPACPTYRLWGEEMDSPRGRIDLVRQALAGRADAGVARRHLDECLSCFACVPACPSGVRYDRLSTAARAELEVDAPRSLGERLRREAVFALLAHPDRLRVAAGLGWLAGPLRPPRPTAGRPSAPPTVALRLAGLLGPELEAALATAPPLRPDDLISRLPRHVGRPEPTGLRVGLLTGCVAAVFDRPTLRATQRVLATLGATVVTLPHQGCCGALSEHAGRLDEAKRLARRLLARWQPLDVDVLVTSAAGCGSTLLAYGHLLREHPEAAAFAAKVTDVTVLVDRLLAEGKARYRLGPLPGRLAYHEACHLRNVQGVSGPPRRILGRVPGLELVELESQDTCCGAAGVYSLFHPGPAAALGRTKAAAIEAARVDAVATANPGCRLQLARYAPGIPVLHPIEVLDAALHGREPPWAAGRRSPTPA
jgi:glycolate oxidase iron-sulfur subunit